MDAAAELAVLFLAALLASTVLPFQSEALVVAALLRDVDVFAVVIVATLGNTLGGLITWACGRLARTLQGKRWFPVSAAQLAKAENWYERWGHWSLLLCWAPFVGEPLVAAAGVLRAPLWLVTLITLPARLARYALVAWLTLSI